VQDIDRLLEVVFAQLQAVTSRGDQQGDLSLWVTEANRIFIVSPAPSAI
jgi:hypothetical protein